MFQESKLGIASHTEARIRIHKYLIMLTGMDYDFYREKLTYEPMFFMSTIMSREIISRFLNISKPTMLASQTHNATFPLLLMLSDTGSV